MLPLRGLRGFAHINSDSVSLPALSTRSDGNLGAVAAARGVVGTMVWCYRCSFEVPEPASSHLHPSAYQGRGKPNDIITTSRTSSNSPSLGVSLEPKTSWCDPLSKEADAKKFLQASSVPLALS